MSLSGLLATKGAAITFTQPATAAAYDSGTDTAAVPPTRATVAGRAMDITEGVGKSDVQQTAVEADALTLAFRPDTAGEYPLPKATCVWAGFDYAVADAQVVAMNGTATGAIVRIER